MDELKQLHFCLQMVNMNFDGNLKSVAQKMAQLLQFKKLQKNATLFLCPPFSIQCINMQTW